MGCYRFSMPDEPERPERNAEKTRSRIIEAAQRIFAEKGYSHTGLREIAGSAGVAVSLIIKHFGSKAGLYEQALTSALIAPEVFQSDRPRFGQRIVEAVSDPSEPMLAPTMIALSVGDKEAREIIERVHEERIVGPMSEWLGTPSAAARARAIVMLTTGYAIFTRPFDGGAAAESMQILADSLQAIVDMSDRD